MAERDAGPGRDEDGRDPLDEDAVWAAIVAGYGEEPPDPDLSPDDTDDVGDRATRTKRADGTGSTDGTDGGDGSSGDGGSRGPGGSGAEGSGGQSGSGPDGSGGQSGSGPDGSGPDGSGPDGSGPDGSGPDGSGADREADGRSEQDVERSDTGDDGDDTGAAAGQETKDARGETAEELLGSSITVHPAIGPRDWSAAEPSDEDSDEGHFVPPEPPPLPEGDTTAKFAWLAVIGGPLLLLLTVLMQWNMTWWITTLGVGGFLGGFATLVIRMGDGDGDEDDDPGRGAVV